VGESGVGLRAWAAKRPWLVVFAAALVVRVLYVVSIRGAYFFDHLVTEPDFYDGWANAIVSGDAPVHLPFDEAPGYAYFVALIYAIVGRSLLAVVLVQAVLGAAACAAIAQVARRLGGERAGWLAGGIAALYGPFIYFTGQLEPAALAVAATSLALAAMPDQDARPRRWILAGAAWAVALAIRSELALCVPFAIAHAWLSAGRRAAARVAAVPAVLLAVSLAANTAASGHPVLLTNGAGVNLWLGNNPDADGVNPFVHGRLGAVVNEVEASTTDPVERDRAFRTHAELSAGLLVKKLIWTFSSRELPNAADIHWQTEQSWLYHRPVFPLAFALVFPLACVGAVLLGRRWREHVVLLGPIAAALAACVVFFTNARFRLVMLPPLIVLAGFALEPLARAVRYPRRDLRHTLRVALGIALGILIAWPSYYDVAHFRVAQIDANTGDLEARAGHLDAAIMYLRSAVANDPDDVAARLELARVQQARGSN
jgi:4-amino-4-deoxy-L-arabinose transferase-like glycosyltransferase